MTDPQFPVFKTSEEPKTEVLPPPPQEKKFGKKLFPFLTCLSSSEKNRRIFPDFVESFKNFFNLMN